MENKKEINLGEFVTNYWNRFKQLIHAQSKNVKETEQPTEEENDKQAEETEDQNENDDEYEPIDDEVKSAQSELQYDDETKLIMEGT